MNDRRYRLTVQRRNVEHDGRRCSMGYVLFVTAAEAQVLVVKRVAHFTHLDDLRAVVAELRAAGQLRPGLRVRC